MKNMRNMTEEEAMFADRPSIWNLIKYLQYELDRKEPATREQIRNAIPYGWNVGSIESLIDAVRPLTVQQGFVVTDDMWKDCPTDTMGWQPVWVVKDIYEGGVARLPMSVNDYYPRPTPPKVKRERRRDEKMNALIAAGWIGGLIGESRTVKDSTIDDLCTAAGIDLWVEE